MHVAVSPWAEVQKLYSAGLFLQAYELGKQFGPLAQWDDREGRVLASRLANTLGAPKLSRVLARLNYRNFPNDWKVRFFNAFCVLERRGPLQAWSYMQAGGDPGEDQQPELRADWLSFRAILLSIVRDFEHAEVYQAQAEELAPESSWVWVQRSAILERQDRIEEAVVVARKALSLRPLYAPAIQQVVQVYASVGKETESLALLLDATRQVESGHLWALLASLQSELGMHADALEGYLRAAECFPLREKNFSNWLYAVTSDEYYYLGNTSKAIEYARQVDSPLYNQFVASMEQSGVEFRKKRLSVGFVRQQHLTCGPATLAALGNYWNRPADHLQIVEQICYDGTPAQSERRWAEENGFIAKEFSVSWDAARALIDRDIPFTLTTIGVNSGHLQAVIGYDEFRKSLVIRDPSSRIATEFAFDNLSKSHEATGLRGMTVLPQEYADRLAGIELPDADLYDTFYEVQRQLERHRRDASQVAIERLERNHPDHRLTLHAKRAIAAYDVDVTGGLQIAEKLLQKYPDDQNIQLLYLSYRRSTARYEELLAELKSRYESGKSDPQVWVMYAQELRNDARQQEEARRVLQHAARYRRLDAAVLRALADLTWNDAPQEALLLYRWTSCLDDTNENHAHSYFTASRWLNQTDVGYQHLRIRYRRFCRRSSAPTITLCEALQETGRYDEALSVLEEALVHRPHDGDLQLYGADFYARLNREEKSKELLERAKEKVHAGALLRNQARLADYRGEVQVALSLWKKVAQIEPLNTDAHARIAVLLRESEGLQAALKFLGEVAARHSYHLPTQRLYIEWLGSGEPVAAERAISELLKRHPCDSWAHRELAITYCKRKAYDLALEAANTAKSLEPNNPYSHRILALVHEVRGEIPQAKAEYRQALAISIDNQDSIESLIRLCGTAEEKRNELQLVRKELARQTIFGEGLVTYRQQAQQLLDAETLLADLRAAHEARPDLWQTWSELGHQYIEMGQLDQARQVFEEAVKKFSLLPRIWSDLAQLYAALNDVEAEIAALEKALEIAPNWGHLSRQLAEVEIRRGDYTRAIAIYKGAIVSDPSDVVTRGCLADLLWKNGHAQGAIEEAKHAIRLNPGYSWAWQALQEWLEKAGRLEELLEIAQMQTEDRPGEARSFTNLCQVQVQLGLHREALASLDRAIELNPLLAEAYEQKAQILADLEEYDEALATCESAHWGGQIPETLQGRAADIRARQGEVDEAIERMRKVVAVSPDYAWGWFRLAEWLDTPTRGKEYFEACRGLARCSPQWAVAQGFLGDAERRFGDHEKALDAFEKAILFDPTYLFAFNTFLDMTKDCDRGRLVQLAGKLVNSPQIPPMLQRTIEVAVALADRELALNTFERLCETSEDEGYLVRSAVLIEDRSWRQQANRIVDRYLKRHAPNVNLGAAKIVLTVGARAKAHWLMQWYDRGILWQRAAETFLDELAETKSQWVFRRFVAKNVEALRAEANLWASCGRVFYIYGQNKRAVEWLADWQLRQGLSQWMTANLVLSLWNLNKYDDICHVAKLSLEVIPDHSASIHRVFLAASLVLQDRARESEEHFPHIDQQQLSPAFRAIGMLAKATAELLCQPENRSCSMRHCRSKLLNALGTEASQLKTAGMVPQAYHEFLKLLAKKRGRWFHVAWYTFWQIRLG